MKLTIEELRALPIYGEIYWKPGLIGYTILKLDENSFDLTHTSNGWYSVEVDINQFGLILSGELDIITLDWA